MPASDFLLHANDAADLRVGHPLVEPPDADADLEHAIERIDGTLRAEYPGRLPTLNAAVAVWAGRTVYGLAQTLVYRDLGEAAVVAVMAVPCPAPLSPAACYAADVAFALLPDVYRLARAVSRDDPLTLALATLGRAWPLSSVGMAGIDATDVSPFWDDDALRRLYVDRVIERGDVARLTDPRTRAAVAAALGAHGSLAPAVAIALETA